MLPASQPLPFVGTCVTAGFPGVCRDARRWRIAGGCGLAGLAAVGYLLTRRHPAPVPIDRRGQENWRMPPLALLGEAEFSTGRKIGMAALRLHLAVATILVIIKIVQVALGH